MSESVLDLVVVGCGAGGLATALQFLQSAPGGRVMVLERTSRAQRGGNTAWTGAFFRLTEDGSPAHDFVSRMMELSEGKTDEAIVRRLAALARPTIQWLNDNGVATKSDLTYFLTSKGPRLMPAGGGAAIVETFAARVEELGGNIEYNTTAQDLITDRGDVIGVEALDSAGSKRRLLARTVVLACGGFQGNPALLDHHLGGRGHELSPIAPGGRSNRGEGIEMATRAGADTDGQFDQFHGEPVDPRTGSAEALVMVYPYGILVDHEAQRFVDEAADTPDNTFEAVAYKIWRDANQYAYLIADQKLMRHDIARAVLTDRRPESALTLEALARRLDLDPQALADTVARYNQAATPGPLELSSLDGISTRGLVPAKSNWARPIDEPPYVAWPVTCAITFTFGGLRTDEFARVLDAAGEPIPGLFAVGEVAGIYHHKYPGATSVLRALAFGRIAGQTAAHRIPNPTAVQ
ncbi:FAD-binding protein [Mycolicibacterium septicum DSM 44393]|uniref:FAD-binding protein n=1 Tax=Mycolicibacterium septicum DSM 44393 TaxID=1341646 RepID=A0A7X6ML74_9MYCO|nr:FAD-binding protein [Mycolicibacterium septicum]NKZ10802.1 FAD-binding protein [Mycolicibacterium septicum DSM 44393]